MTEQPFSARFRYVDAAEVANQPTKFDDLAVRTTDGEQLGKVDGFIFDTVSGLLQYVVVDSGGWFKSRSYLLPAGHARLDGAGSALQIDVTKERLQAYPEFERERFQSLSDDDLRKFEREMAAACCPEDGLGDNPLVWGYQRWSHYRQPDWWKGKATASA